MLRRKKKDKAKVGDKVYCGQCKHDPKDSGYCPVNPSTMSMEYFAPGATTQHSEMCAMKNMKNDCPDFKQK